MSARRRWLTEIDMAIRGEHVIVMSHTPSESGAKFRECREDCDGIGLAYDAKVSYTGLWIIVGDSIRDGCIEFTTYSAERRRWGLDCHTVEHMGFTDWTW